VPGPQQRHAGPSGTARFASRAWRAVPCRSRVGPCRLVWPSIGRLAHVGMKNLHKLLKREHILGLTNVHFEKDRVCNACQAGKQIGAHHPHKNIMTTDIPLELLHMDLFGPIAYISIGGSNYCIVLLLWMIILASLGCSFCRKNLKPKRP
jgi:hypothetical protein